MKTQRPRPLDERGILKFQGTFAWRLRAMPNAACSQIILELLFLLKLGGNYSVLPVIRASIMSCGKATALSNAFLTKDPASEPISSAAFKDPKTALFAKLAVSSPISPAPSIAPLTADTAASPTSPPT